MKKKEIHLVADPYPPYQFEEKGVIRGIDCELIGHAFQESGYNTVTHLMPWEECLRRLELREADGIFQIVRTPERAKKFIFSDPFRTAKTVLFSTRSIRFKENADVSKQLGGFKLGVLSGYSYDPLIDTLNREMKVEVGNQEEMLQGLKEERFDLIPMDLGVAEYLIKERGLKGIRRVQGFTLKRELYAAFRPGCENLVKAFNEGLRKIKKRHVYERIIERYGFGAL